MTHLEFDRISDLADAEMTAHGTAREDETRHLASCAECRATLTGLRSLLTASRSLPREVTPPLETWTRLRARVGVRSSGPEAASHRWGRWLAAAASIILVVSAALLIPGGRGKGTVVKAKAMAVSQPPAAARVELHYAPALAELRASVEARRAQYAPAAARVVDRTLAVIDDAIAETREAIVSDPQNPALVDMLSSHYERKVELLQRAAELAPSS